MTQRILVIDIGNTSTSLGLFRGGKVSRRRYLTTEAAQGDEVSHALEAVANGGSFYGVAVASVVPGTRRRWQRAIRTVTDAPVCWVDHRVNLGIKITYPKPETIGADRLANACGAAARYGTPAIVADFGTALTFDVISRADGYVGGVIAPGLPLMFSYLAEKTALLPRIELAPVRHFVGKTTEEAMRLGARWGYRGMVREILAELKQHLGPGRVRLCATGGFAAEVLRGIKPKMIVDKDLTLYGLGRIFELNKGL